MICSESLQIPSEVSSGSRCLAGSQAKPGTLASLTSSPAVVVVAICTARGCCHNDDDNKNKTQMVVGTRWTATFMPVAVVFLGASHRPSQCGQWILWGCWVRVVRGLLLSDCRDRVGTEPRRKPPRSGCQLPLGLFHVRMQNSKGGKRHPFSWSTVPLSQKRRWNTAVHICALRRKEASKLKRRSIHLGLGKLNAIQENIPTTGCWSCQLSDGRCLCCSDNWRPVQTHLSKAQGTACGQERKERDDAKKASGSRQIWREAKELLTPYKIK